MVFHKAIERAEKSDDVNQRVKNLIDSITYSVFMYTTRGLFERDKLTFTSQVTFQVSISNMASTIGDAGVPPSQILLINFGHDILVFFNTLHM